MSSVDDRIVNMKFNNSQFGQGVDKSKRDLTGLEKVITSTGKSKGMTELTAATEGARAKFSALQIAGVAALSTIVAKATMAGMNMIKSLTISPIMDGFREYTTNLESIQTIMANTGKDVKTVNKYLGELNEYADQTIYNFSQMAKNIGTFTAAGVELDTATSAIKGISNLAALSGSTSQQASTAMYQLSQAISAGRVGLQDWNSVVNAGMGGKVFKNALAQTAVAMGNLSAGAVKVGTDVTVMGQSFRQSISAAAGQESWLSSEVLVKTLAQLDGRFSHAALKADEYLTRAERVKKMDEERLKLAKEGVVYSDKEFAAMQKKADAAYKAATQIKTATQLMDVMKESVGSMWANAFQVILGDFDQSKKLWMKVGDEVLGILDGISFAFINNLKEWEKRGGREKVLEGLGNIFGGLLDVMDAVKLAFGDIFPPDKINFLHRLSKAFLSFSENLVPGKDTLEDIREIAKAFFSVLDLGLAIVKGVSGGLFAFFGALFKSTNGARGGLLSMVATIAKVITSVTQFLTGGNKLQRFLKGIGKTAGTALSPIVASVGLLVDAFGSLISGKGLGGASDAFGRAKDVFSGFIGNILTGLDQITAPFDGLKSDIADLAIKMAAPFQGVIDKFNELRLKVVEGLGLDTISPSLDGLKELLGKVQDKLTGFAESLRLPSLTMADLGNAADWTLDKIEAMVTAINDAVKGLDIGEKLTEAKDAIVDFFSGVGKGASSGGSSAAAKSTSAMAATAEGAGTAFDKLGSVMSGIGDIFMSIAGAIGDAFGVMVDAIKKIPFPDDALEWATLLNVLISGALIKKLLFTKGPIEQLRDSIKLMGKSFADAGESISGAFGQMTDTLKTMQNSVKAKMIQAIAIAVALLVGSLIALSFVPKEQIAVGIGAIGAMMGMVTLMMDKLMGDMEGVKPKDLATRAAAMVAVGNAMVAMASAVAIMTAAVIALSFVPWQKLAQGIGAVGIMLGLMVLALWGMSKLKGTMVQSAAAMVLMAIAVNIMVGAVVALGLLPFNVLAQGLVGVAAGIGIMVLALELLSKDPKGIAAAGLAMVLMATAINIMVGAITVLGLLPMDVIKQGLIAVGIGLLMMVAAIAVLAFVGPSVLAAGAAMLMIAGALNILMGVIIGLGVVPWSVVKQGLIAMAAGLTLILLAALAAMYVLPGLVALTLVITAIGAAMLMAGAGFFLFATGLTLLVAVGVAAIAIIVLAIQAFIALLPTIALSMAAAFVTFIQAIALAAPKLRKAFGTIFKEMLGTVRDAIPEIGKLFQTLIDTAIGILSDSIPQFIDLAFTIIDSFLASLDEKLPGIIDSAVSLVTNFIDGIAERVNDIRDSGEQLLIDLMDGLAESIENSNKIRDSAWNLIKTFADEIKEVAGEVLSKLDLTQYLPKMSFKSIKAKLTGGDNETSSRKVDTTALQLSQDLPMALQNAGLAITKAIDAFTEGMGESIKSLVIVSKTAQRDASASSMKAEAQSTSADIAEAGANAQRDRAEGMKGTAKITGKGAKRRGTNKKGKEVIKAEKAEKEARRQRKLADNQAKKALADQQKADFAAAKSDYAVGQRKDAETYKDDPSAFGDSRSQVGQDLANEADALAASAQVKANEAKRLEQLAAKGGAAAQKYRNEAAKFRKQALAESKQAMDLAALSIEAQAQAAAAYAEARKQAAAASIASIEDLKAEQQARVDAKKWEDDYEAAKATVAQLTEEEKAAGAITKEQMLRDRMEKSQADADAANKILADAYADAETLKQQIASNPDSVTAEQVAAIDAALVRAEEAAAKASTAMDAVEKDQDALDQLLQTVSSANSSGSGSSITPSRTALEDAELAVDRYSASVAQSEEAASSEQPVTQFVQNNYSPEALSPSTIYRQTKNLTSAADLKIGV